ncbi:MAG: hypothetical protein CVU91_07205 [Firmicutes bacterium HGW-Firmicutes-16]|nr:MAG: hypothetical protein CVU91_07205 [Firmicutes bacterium HGW-Firmicutes-16]
MEGINKITERIAAETQLEIEALQAETTEKCRAIKEEYSGRAQEEYWKLIREGAKECEAYGQRLAGAAALEAKKSVLAMKQDAVLRVFDKALETLCSLPEKQYIEFMARQAASAASTGLEEIVFNARDKATCAKAVTKEANELLKNRGLLPKLTVSEKTGNFRGGLMVKQGDIEVNCTIEKLVELSKSELATQVVAVLFAV